MAPTPSIALTFVLLAVASLHAATQIEPPVAVEEADRVVLESFLSHARNEAKGMTVEELKKVTTPETFGWVQAPKLNMSLTAYAFTGKREHLDDFVAAFENLRSLLVKGGDGFLGWYGKPIPPLVDPAKPDVIICEIQADFRVAAVVARFVEIVAADPELKKAYQTQHDAYLDLITNHLVKKWDANGYYTALDNGAATYRWNKDYIPTKANITLAHEKQSAMIDALLVLYRVTKQDVYRDKAQALGAYLKRCLTKKDGRYTWNYWDATGDWDKADGKLKHWMGPEPQGGWYAATVGSIVQLHDAGLVFDEQDIQKLVRTQMEVCWNGNLETPEFFMVTGAKPKPTERFAAPSLARWSPKLSELLFKGKWQEERIAKAENPWHGGVLAGDWLRAKYLSPKAK